VYTHGYDLIRATEKSQAQTGPLHPSWKLHTAGCIGLAIFFVRGALKTVLLPYLSNGYAGQRAPGRISRMDGPFGRNGLLQWEKQHGGYNRNNRNPECARCHWFLLEAPKIGYPR
jgi:hypothetical protein